MSKAFSYIDIVHLDTKAGILESIGILGIKVSKKLLTSELADILVNVFEENPFLLIDSLPSEEQELVSKLMGSKQIDYIEVPISEQRLGLQIHHRDRGRM